jgi:uncharacterized LabA/DUF88 family protein
MSNDRLKLAVFFDAENVNLRHASSILQKLSVNWEIHLKRAYGSNVSAQQDVLRELSIVPVEVLRNINAKNATDLALTVDAMEELCAGFSDGICIVSGDSDFTRLVQRIREKGKAAIAFGNENTPTSLRNACTAFQLIPATEQAQSPMGKTPKLKASEKPAQGAKTKQKIKTAPSTGSAAKPPQPVTAQQGMDPVAEASLREALRSAFKEFRSSSENDTLGNFGQFIRKSHPKLHQRNYGFARLRALLARVGGFQIEVVHGEGGVISGHRLSLEKEPPKTRL